MRPPAVNDQCEVPSAMSSECTVWALTSATKTLPPLATGLERRPPIVVFHARLSLLGTLVAVRPLRALSCRNVGQSSTEPSPVAASGAFP